MKNRKILILLLCSFIVVSTVISGGCTKTSNIVPESISSQTPTSKPTHEAITEIKDTAIKITDMTGREIVLDGPVTRVVALTPSDCEILYAVGAGETLVGRGEFCDYPQEVLNVPVVQSGVNTNLEQIISLKPQVLLMNTMAQTEEQVEALEAAGIKVVVSAAYTIEEVYDSVSMIGALMNREAEAKAVIASMKETFAEVSAKASDFVGKTIYFEVSPLEYGLWTAGSGTFMNEIAEMIGLKNCFADVTGWCEISEEQVLERNPDYILTVAMYFGEGTRPEEEIMNRKGWENVTAVKNRAVLNLYNNELSRPSPRLADGARMLFDFINGTAVKD
ncbi:MAG: ABC transporter substrate-binding protein [Clostridiaceae bacterium]|nr:ABC transporter substrate-binding protein [Clostridiaceae bacterium]